MSFQDYFGLREPSGPRYAVYSGCKEPAGPSYAAYSENRKQVQDDTLRVSQETHKVIQSSLKGLTAIEEGGAKQLEVLQSQGEQIDRIGGTNERIQDSLNKGKKSLGVIESLRGQLRENLAEARWKTKKKPYRKQEGTVRDIDSVPSIWASFHTQASKPRCLSGDTPVSFCPEARLNEIQRRNNEALDEMNRKLQRIKQQALLTGDTLTQQNGQLQDLSEGLNQTDRDLQSCIRRTNRVLS